MLRNILLRLLLLSGFLGFIFSSWLLWLNDSFNVEINNNFSENYIDDGSKIKNYSFLFPSPIKNFLKQAIKDPNSDVEFSLKLLDLYLKENPLDASMWVIGSQLYQRKGNLDAASKTLTVAYNLSRTNTPILFKIFNRYLELGLIEAALPVAHDIVLAKPSEFRRIFYLMSRLIDDYSLVVSHVIPKEDGGFKKQFSYDQYFYWALSDAIRAKNNTLASVVWNEIPVEFKGGGKFGLIYINFLVKRQEIGLLKDVWSDVVGAEIRLSQVLNSGSSNYSPCWHIRENDGVNVNLDNIHDELLMKVDFMGEKNVDYSHLSCLVHVLPGRTYRLSGEFKGEDITTLSGPYIDVVFPGVKSSYFRSDVKVGTWPWTDFGLTFNVPEGVHFAKVRVRRKKTRLLNSKIAGSVWFKGIEVESVVK